ncbi:hypothetical protein C8J56DRAFT_927787 [Mycena floridula]|nr:hypothetical protein C8J56DRAFT_927787 [Mycena floridula]
MLDSMVMRYIPALQGVVLSHSNLTFLQNTATINGACPFLICDVGFDATIWSPAIAMKLTGKVNLCSPDHISLLVHRTFNASIPRHHIQTDEWEFEYGPAENDPEFGPAANEELEDGEAEKVFGESSGKWVHKITGDTLGGEDGYLEFTVIGLTVANEMLSVVGSLQSDPFSPLHVAAAPMKDRPAESDSSPEDEVVRRNVKVDSDAEDVEDEIENADDVEAEPEQPEKVVKKKRGKDEKKVQGKRKAKEPGDLPQRDSKKSRKKK